MQMIHLLPHLSIQYQARKSITLEMLGKGLGGTCFF
jgi:hypothetical protein